VNISQQRRLSADKANRNGAGRRVSGLGPPAGRFIEVRHGMCVECNMSSIVYVWLVQLQLPIPV